MAVLNTRVFTPRLQKLRFPIGDICPKIHDLPFLCQSILMPSHSYESPLLCLPTTALVCVCGRIQPRRRVQRLFSRYTRLPNPNNPILGSPDSPNDAGFRNKPAAFRANPHVYHIHVPIEPENNVNRTLKPSISTKCRKIA